MEFVEKPEKKGRKNKVTFVGVVGENWVVLKSGVEECFS
jgi:hypothetical protein